MQYLNVDIDEARIKCTFHPDHQMTAALRNTLTENDYENIRKAFNNEELLKIGKSIKKTTNQFLQESVNEINDFFRKEGIALYLDYTSPY